MAALSESYIVSHTWKIYVFDKESLLLFWGQQTTCRQIGRLLVTAGNSQLTHWRVSHKLFYSAPRPSLDLISITPSPFFNHIHLLLDNAITTVATSMDVYGGRWWLTFFTSGNGDDPVLVCAAEAEIPGKRRLLTKVISYTDTMLGADKIDPLEYLLSVLLAFEITPTLSYPIIFIVSCGSGTLLCMTDHTKMYSNNN